MLYINFQLLMYHTVLNESQNCEILVIMIDIIIWSDVRIISEKNLGWSASAPTVR